MTKEAVFGQFSYLLETLSKTHLYVNTSCINIDSADASGARGKDILTVFQPVYLRLRNLW